MRKPSHAVIALLMASPLGACGKVWYESGTSLTGTSRPLLTTAAVRTIYRSEVEYEKDQRGREVRVRPNTVHIVM